MSDSECLLWLLVSLRHRRLDSSSFAAACARAMRSALLRLFAPCTAVPALAAVARSGPSVRHRVSRVGLDVGLIDGRQFVWSCFDTGRRPLDVVAGAREEPRRLVTLDVTVAIAALGSAPSTRTWTPVSDRFTSVYEARSLTIAAASSVSVSVSSTRQLPSSSSTT